MSLQNATDEEEDLRRLYLNQLKQLELTKESSERYAMKGRRTAALAISNAFDSSDWAKRMS